MAYVVQPKMKIGDRVVLHSGQGGTVTEINPASGTFRYLDATGRARRVYLDQVQTYGTPTPGTFLRGQRVRTKLRTKTGTVTLASIDGGPVTIRNDEDGKQNVIMPENLALLPREEDPRASSTTPPAMPVMNLNPDAVRRVRNGGDFMNEDDDVEEDN